MFLIHSACTGLPERGGLMGSVLWRICEAHKSFYLPEMKLKRDNFRFVKFAYNPLPLPPKFHFSIS